MEDAFSPFSFLKQRVAVCGGPAAGFGPQYTIPTSRHCSSAAIRGHQTNGNLMIRHWFEGYFDDRMRDFA